MAEIFRLNGLGLGDVEVKNRLQTCLDFVKEAEDVREYVAECIENANSLLTKWFYQKQHEVSYRHVHDFCDDHSEIDGRR